MPETLSSFVRDFAVSVVMALCACSQNSSSISESEQTSGQAVYEMPLPKHGARPLHPQCKLLLLTD